MKIKQTMMPLTALAHEKVGDVLVCGDLALDLTTGNGHDTLLLAKSVGEKGKVIGFDIQARAIELTKDRLSQAGLLQRVELINEGHEELAILKKSAAYDLLPEWFLPIFHPQFPSSEPFHPDNEVRGD